MRYKFSVETSDAPWPISFSMDLPDDDVAVHQGRAFAERLADIAPTGKKSAGVCVEREGREISYLTHTGELEKACGQLAPSNAV